jgi:DNA relaxase NicK
MAIQITIDWISATSHETAHRYEYVAYPQLHDWENWKLCAGINGYTLGSSHVSGVKTFYNPQRKDMGKHIIYTGKVLQKLVNFYDIGKFDILRHHIDAGHNITRLDVAIDFIDTDLRVQSFQDAFTEGLAETRLKSASIVKSLSGAGHTLYIGSRKKRKNLVRVYDKQAEAGLDYRCIRVELQIMGKKATKAGIVITNEDNLKQTCLGVIKQVIHFPSIELWHDMMLDVNRVRLNGDIKTESNTRLWLLNQIPKNIAKEIQIDVDFWAQFKMQVDSACGSIGVDFIE